jgi:hypothetical protein
MKCTALFDKYCKAAWQEVKEETTTKSSQLPDWCKVAEVVYDNLLREYCCVEEYEERDWYINNIESGRIKQARKRPFNDKEMEALVGKVIKGEGRIDLIFSFNMTNKKVETNYAFYDAELLMDGNFTIDGKPCYVLEHLENGEWVE